MNESEGSLDIRKWEIVHQEEVLQAKRYSILAIDFILPGDKTRKETFFIKKEPDAVGILAITNNGKIIMIEHFRPGPGEIITELPGGDVDPEEDPLKSAARELIEETGFRGKKAILIGSSCKDAYSTGHHFSVVITGCVYEGIPKNHKKHPQLRQVVLVTLDEFRELLINQRMTNSEIGFRGLHYLKML